MHVVRKPDFDASTLPTRWTPSDASRVLTAINISGLTVAAFARLHELCEQRIYRWRRRLREAVPPETGTVPRFVPVKVVPSAVRRVPPQPFALFLDGVKVEVPSDFDAASLGRLLEVLVC